MRICLIVEDNPVCWMIMQNQMQKLGYSTVLCMNGREALDYCEKFSMPPLILLDGYMPGMDGLTFLREIRAREGGNAPYIIFCSSSMDREDVDEALSIGADCHIPKPLDPEQLIAVVRQIDVGNVA